MLDPRLFGRWHRQGDELSAVQNFSGASVLFGEDGTLVYELDIDGRKRIALREYRIEVPGIIVSEQPFAPAPQRTHYELDAIGRLVLKCGGKRSVYVRAIGSSPTSASYREG